MKEIDAAWLAGILEGEGCFTYQGTPWVRLSMTDQDVVERAAILMQTHCHPMPLRYERKKRDFRANVCGDRAIETMRIILPHMGIRRSAKIKEVLAQAVARLGNAFGERAGSAKLTDAQADEIRRTYVKFSRKSGHNSVELAKKYGVSQAAISYVVNKRRNADGGQPMRAPP